MLNFLIFLYLWVFEISCSAEGTLFNKAFVPVVWVCPELSMKFFLKPQGQAALLRLTAYSLTEKEKEAKKLADKIQKFFQYNWCYFWFFNTKSVYYQL